MVMGEGENWKKKYYITQRNYKQSKGGYGRLALGDVYACNGILSRACKFEKANWRTFIHKFIAGFADRGFGFPWQPPINIIYETR